MQLDKLELDLKPRPNAQALDLGFALLRAHAADTYMAWLALWLPLTGVCAALACVWRDYIGVFMLIVWWFRPILERAPLYVLSREVFGEHVSWREAVRAWPSQLGGGWFYLLTWGRLFCAGRALYQPIWQLESARGSVAAERRKIIGKSQTARSSFWFGIACANFELILQVGLLLFIGIFVSDEGTVNPFILFKKIIEQNGNLSITMVLLIFLGYAFAGAVIGPIFTACGFTLYLNRRATLEAWDLEIVLRQIKPPQRKGASGMGAKAASLLTLLCGAALIVPMLLASPASYAADVASPPTAQASNLDKCKKPDWFKEREDTRQAAQSQDQTDIRRDVDQIFDTDEMRGYSCEYTWARKNEKLAQNKPEEYKPEHEPAYVSTTSTVLKIVLIAMLIGIVAAFLYRYRGELGALVRSSGAARATEIAGMDIRPESLPDDVAKQVGELWQRGQRRAALALLYRATVSRLVNDNHLPLTQGATEGDCLRQVLQAQRRQEVTEMRSAVTRAVTDIWLNAAYGDRWPSDAVVVSQCNAWRGEFQRAATGGAA